MDKKILSNLCSAALQIKPLSNNIFLTIGHDDKNSRLGWVIPPDFKAVEKFFQNFSLLAKNKKEFVFIGMGGSINGIKVLAQFTKTKNIHTFDSLDPYSLNKIISNIKNKKNLLVVPITKSGTTLETHRLANCLKNLYKNEWHEHFLWLADPSSFEKIYSRDWEKVHTLPIQVNHGNDIGGRFTCPHTAIFLIPLFIIWGGKINKIKALWGKYIKTRKESMEKACKLASSLKDLKRGYFSILVRKKFKEPFNTWITQLFQESLGSKNTNFKVKTKIISDKKQSPDYFTLIEVPNFGKDPILYIMSAMVFLQFFVALFAYYKKINFVNQPYVEEYKKQMKELEKTKMPEPCQISLNALLEQINARLNTNIKFIELVFYFDLDMEKQKKVYHILKEKFYDKEIFISIGSDWNHHSYQSAFLDDSTLFIILVAKSYRKSDIIPKNFQDGNTAVLESIAYATFVTLKEKAILYKISDTEI